MAIVPIFIALQLVCLWGGLGVTYAALRKTRFASDSILIAPAVFPVVSILTETCGGNSIPHSLAPLVTPLLAAIFTIYSIYMVWSDRSLIRAEYRQWLLKGALLAAATVFGMTSIASDIAHNSPSYPDIGLNDELLNYSAFALHLMGRTLDHSYAALFDASANVRSGADLLIAAISYALRVPPANCIYLLIALLRAHAIAAFAFLLLRCSDGKMANKWLFSGMALFAFSPIQMLNYSASFLSHYTVAPIVILVTALLASEATFHNGPAIAFAAALELYVWIAYSEAIPSLLVIQGIEGLGFALRKRTPRYLFIALLPAVSIFLVSPALGLERLEYFLYIAKAQAGFVLFTPASAGILSFLSTVFGLRFAGAGVRIFDNTCVEGVVVFALILFAGLALWRTFRFERQDWSLVPLLVLGAATLITWTNQAEGTGIFAIYKAEKAIVYVQFLFLAALVLAVAQTPKAGAWRYFAPAAYSMMLFGAAQTGVAWTAGMASWKKSYAASEVGSALERLPQNASLVLPRNDLVSSMYWNEAIQYYGISNRYSGRKKPSPLFDASENNQLSVENAAPGKIGFDIVDTTRLEVDAKGGWHAVDLPSERRRDEAFYLQQGLIRRGVTRFTADFRVRPEELTSELCPLLTTGRAGSGAVIMLRPLGAGKYRLEHDAWGLQHTNGAEIGPAPGAQEDELHLEGSGDGSSLFTVSATERGREVLRFTGEMPGMESDTVFWGKDGIGFPGLAKTCAACSTIDVHIN